jgi:serine protease AprX
MRVLLSVLFALFSLAPLAASAQPFAKRSAALSAALSGAPRERTVTAWVFFSDKGARAQARTDEARGLVTARALARRAVRGAVGHLSAHDLALVPAYVEQVAAQVERVRHRSRWFNAISVEATPLQIGALEALPFVERLDVVRRYQRAEPEPVRADPATGRSSAVRGAGVKNARGLDYGASLGQLAQLGVPAVHDLGFHGEGVVVAVLDAGFSDLSHEVFSSLHIMAARDFVNGDEDVADGRDRGEGSHGTMTLSVLGGLQEGRLVGPAYAADFILAKTENTDSETPVEEDNWAAAAEWAESLGADVISSSLGYLRYDSPFPSYGFADMDGQSAISTRAAEMAAERGVVVVNSAGNSGFHATHNTLGAPADGAHVLAIAAVDATGARASFSSVGPSADGRIKPDLAAQGQSVTVAFPGTVSGYGTANGTSFSCPLVAGVVALLLQVNPGATPEDIAGVLRSTAGQAGRPDTLLGWGIVNAEVAVKAWLPAPLAVR